MVYGYRLYCPTVYKVIRIISTSTIFNLLGFYWHSCVVIKFSLIIFVSLLTLSQYSLQLRFNYLFANIARNDIF